MTPASTKGWSAIFAAASNVSDEQLLSATNSTVQLLQLFYRSGPKNDTGALQQAVDLHAKLLERVRDAPNDVKASSSGINDDFGDEYDEFDELDGAYSSSALTSQQTRSPRDHLDASRLGSPSGIIELYSVLTAASFSAVSGVIARIIELTFAALPSFEDKWLQFAEDFGAFRQLCSVASSESTSPVQRNKNAMDTLGLLSETARTTANILALSPRICQLLAGSNGFFDIVNGLHDKGISSLHAASDGSREAGQAQFDARWHLTSVFGLLVAGTLAGSNGPYTDGWWKKAAVIERLDIIRHSGSAKNQSSNISNQSKSTADASIEHLASSLDSMALLLDYSGQQESLLPLVNTPILFDADLRFDLASFIRHACECNVFGALNDDVSVKLFALDQIRDMCSVASLQAAAGSISGIPVVQSTASSASSPASSSATLGSGDGFTASEQITANVSQIQELFPDLSDDFVKLCLREYQDNPELVTMALLEDALPPKIAALDRKSYKEPSIVKQPQSQPQKQPQKQEQAQQPSSGDAVKDFVSERHNIYDGDEFDVMSGAKIDSSRVHKGKKSYANAMKESVDKSLIMNQVSRQEREAEAIEREVARRFGGASDAADVPRTGGAQYTITRMASIDAVAGNTSNMYDDEYDDTYDDEHRMQLDAPSIDDLRTGKTPAEEDDAAESRESSSQRSKQSKKQPVGVAGAGGLSAAVERQLIAAFNKDHSIFSRAAATRRSKPRVDLRQSTGLDDNQIEGWGIEFKRNPHREQLLAMGTGGGPMPASNPNRSARGEESTGIQRTRWSKGANDDDHDDGDDDDNNDDDSDEKDTNCRGPATSEHNGRRVMEPSRVNFRGRGGHRGRGRGGSRGGGGKNKSS
ncbi:hypothetical protein GQ42DRAFT_164104 [Ramicandelaber brevisporus]|nr:hypothetical protein GQ42DRAFT_164104 [Ramicandelaber brevisporus]